MNKTIKRLTAILCAFSVVIGATACQSKEIVTESNVSDPIGNPAAAPDAPESEQTESEDTPSVPATSVAEPVVEVTTTGASSDAQPPEVTTTEPLEEPVPPEATTTEPTEEPVPPEEQPVPVEQPPLTAEDVQIEIEGGNVFTTNETSLKLNYTYIGEAEGAEYCFGCEYSLYKEHQKVYEPVAFSENAAFISLGYLIGTDCPNNSTTVSLNDDFYAEPLTAGNYMVVKPMCDGVELRVFFQLVDPAEDLMANYVVESVDGELTLTINEKRDNELVCSLVWPYPAVYTVTCDGIDLEDFCVGDNIEVQYSEMYKSKTNDFDYIVCAKRIDYSDFELDPNVAYKPVIYLYPEEVTEAEVKVYFNGELTVTYPEYNGGWNVTAHPDGTLYTADGNEYSYLFWEGDANYSYEMNEGFCVKGSDTVAFLREKLAFLGLTPKEYNDFIVFWLPFMQDNEYNIITFQTDGYTDNAILDVTPDPDTVIRVFMTFTPTDEYVEIAPQILEKAPARDGFTVVEWGGSIVR